MLNIASAALLSIGFGSAMTPAGQDSQPFSEAYEAPITDVTAKFECRGYSVTMHYVRDNDAASSESPRMRRMRLLGVSYGRRRLAPAQVEKGRALFAAFAIIDRVTATCYDGKVEIALEGVSRQAWSELLRGARSHPLPRSLSSMRVGRRGVEQVSMPK